MRLFLLGFAPVLLTSAVLCAQATAPVSQADVSKAAPATGDAQSRSADTIPAATSAATAPPPQAKDDTIARGDARAAARPQKDQAKAAEKAKREAEQNARLLRLQDNEIVATRFDEAGNAVKLPPCAKDDTLCQKKRKELLRQKKVELNVKNGTLSIDGFVAKTHLNYDVKNFQYLYVSVPDYGTVVISPERFLNSSEAREALDGKTVTITTADQREVRLESEGAILGKQKRSLYYAIDRAYSLPGNRPSIGYGFVSKAPYVWPGSATVEPRRVALVLPDASKRVQARDAAPQSSSGSAIANIDVAENRPRE